MLVLSLSACETIALKSLTLMPIRSFSSTLNSSKSNVSMAMEVCKGCLRISVDHKYDLYLSIEFQTFVRRNFLRVASESYTSFV